MAATAIILAGGARDGGGVERVVAYYTREMERLGAGDKIRLLHSRTGSGRFALHSTPLIALAKLASLIRRERVDVVHLNVAPRGSTFRKSIFLDLAKSSGAKVLLQLHGSGYDEFYKNQSGLIQAIIRRFFRRADMIVVLSNYWRDFVVSELKIPSSKVLVVSNGVPDPQCRADLTAEIPNLVFAGALGERKGTDVLLDALGRLAADGVKFTCSIMGGGDVDGYTAEAERLGLARRVRFLGWQSEQAVRDEMRQSSIFVLPSRRENQPVAILEAMALGLPVVSTAIGAIPEQVEDGVTGFIVPPGDATALAHALAKLITSADLRRRQGTAARMKWESSFSAKVNAQQLLAAYATLRTTA